MKKSNQKPIVGSKFYSFFNSPETFPELKSAILFFYRNNGFPDIPTSGRGPRGT